MWGCYQSEVFLCHTQVTYQADQFLDKNKDYVVAEHQDLLNASSCPFVAGLFPPLPQETSKSSKFSSIGSRFKVWTSVTLLLIRTSYFICCLWINKISFFSSYHFQLICIFGSISPVIEAICTPLHFVCLILFKSFFLFLRSVQMFVFYVLVHENGKARLLILLNVFSSCCW